MKKMFVCVGLGLSMAVLSGSAMAQFGGMLGKSSNSSGASSVTAESLVKSYVSGSKNVMTGQSNLLAAVGLKEASENQALKAQGLTETATTSALEDASKIQTEGSKQLQDQLNSGSVTLDANGKKKYAQGLFSLAKGIKDYTGMSGDVKNFKPAGLSSLGGAAGAALFVAKDLPGSTSNLMATLKAAIAFARSNNIKLDKETTSLLPD